VIPVLPPPDPLTPETPFDRSKAFPSHPLTHAMTIGRNYFFPTVRLMHVPSSPLLSLLTVIFHPMFLLSPPLPCNLPPKRRCRLPSCILCIPHSFFPIQVFFLFLSRKSRAALLIPFYSSFPLLLLLSPESSITPPPALCLCIWISLSPSRHMLSSLRPLARRPSGVVAPNL
jgi:hypothetical protein